MLPGQPLRSYVPKYEHLNRDDSTAVLVDFENQTRRKLSIPITPSNTPIRRKIVRLNLATDEDLWNDLQVVHRVGIRTLNKITTERAINGSFHGAADFDRRVKGVKFSTLEKACAEQEVSLSFETSPIKRPKAEKERRPYIHPSLLQRTRPCGFHDPQPIKDDFVLSSWNAGRMSTSSERYEEKVGHLFRFLTDSQTDILSLQEVCEGVADDLCNRLFERTGVIWSCCEAYETSSGSGLATLFRLDKFFEHDDIKQLETLLTVLPFKRVPEVVVLSGSETDDEYIVLINVHLNQADPREEIAAVATIVRKLRQMFQNDEGEEVIIVLGDFNMNSDSPAFSPMRDLGLVELIRPPTSTGWVWHPYHTIQTSTTIGNQWYDNIWISKESRHRIGDAWCFDFGGRRQSLEQSGHQYAAHKRASCSDHLPIVAKIQHGPQFSDA